MARRAGLALAALLFAFCASAAQPLREWTQKSTPALALRDLDGKSVDLTQLEGRVVVVNFWATWCEPCIAEMPSLQRLKAALGDKPFQVLAVNYGESDAKVRAFLRKAGLSLEVLLDPDKEAADRWGAKGLPMTFIVDARGRARYWVFGERDWNDDESRKAVQKLLAEATHAR